MKQDDFERLKAICEREGFECSDVFSDGRVAIIEKKKDPWEGVEFVECVDDNGSGKGCYTIGRIYPLKTVVGDTVQTTIDDSGDFNGWNKRFFKPSTEYAYVEQLKKEAFERFGEIKEGDRFRRDFEPKLSNIKEFSIGDRNYTKNGFRYNKGVDSLSFDGYSIYRQGKWAEMVKDRVKIEPVLIVRNGETELHEFTFKSNRRDIPLSAGDFLASQLEKYLNGEIE